MGSVPGASSSTIFFKMAANMAAMQKHVADKKLNSRTFTQFFSTIYTRLHEHLRQLSFQNGRQYGRHAQDGRLKKANRQILTLFFPSNMLTTI